MSKYGLFLYGTKTYGSIINVGAFYNAELVASAYDYNKTVITWNSVAGDPLQRSITHWKLIKSYGGVPDTPYLGTMLAGGTFNNFNTIFYDEDTNDGVIYYSIWVFDGSKWINCGSDYVIAATDDGTLSKMEKWFPAAWLNSYYGFGDATGEPEDNYFNSFLGALAFSYDIGRKQVDITSKLSDGNLVPSYLLGQKIQDYGFTYEPSLGDIYHRSLYKAGFHILSEKGTAESIQTFINSLVHWSSTITKGTNEMLDYNDSSFEESVGRWTLLGGTLDSKLYSTSSTDLGLTLTPPVPNLYNYDYPMRQLGYGLLTLNSFSGKTVVLTLPTPPNPDNPDEALNAVLYGVPVLNMKAILVTGWIKHIDNPVSITVGIDFWDESGAHLGTTYTGPSTTTSSGWIEFSSGTLNRKGLAVPLGAVYATLTLTVTFSGSQFDKAVIDMLQVTEGGVTSLEYQDPRRTTFVIDGEYSNIVTNPTFEEGVTGWMGYNAAISQENHLLDIFAGSATYAPSDLLRPNMMISTFGTGTSGTNTIELDNTISGVPPVNFRDLMQGMYVMSDLTTKWATITNVTIIDNDHATVVLSENITANLSGTITFYNIFDTAVAKVTALTDGSFGIVSNWLTASASKEYFGQVDVSSNTETMNPATIRVEFSSPQKDSDQTLALVDDSGVSYYSNANQLVEATTMDMMTMEMKPLTPMYSTLGVQVLSPDATQDSPQPLAKLSVYVNNAMAGDVFYITNASLSHTMLPGTDMMTMTNMQFFHGDGAPMPMDPTMNLYFSDADCYWEVRTRYNYLNNPGFDTNTTGWTATGATISSSATQYKFGNKSMKVVKSGSTASVSTTVYPPYALITEGSYSEDYTCSAYIYGPAGTYTITATAGSVSVSNTLIIDSNAANKDWLRVTVSRIPVEGETSFTLTISSTASTFYVDGVQVEDGQQASKYIDVTDPFTFKVPNIGNDGSFYWGTRVESNNGGISNVWFNEDLKSYRLNQNLLDGHIPLGGSYALQLGKPAFDAVYTEYGSNNLIESPSFEKSLLGWTPVSSSLSRSVAKGSLFNDLCSHGQAYCVVNGTTSGMGIISNRAEIFTNKAVRSSVVVKAPDSTGLGTYTMTLKFYKYDGTLVVDATQTTTYTITQTNLWYYLRLQATQPQLYGKETSFCQLTVTFTPATSGGTHTFYIDRTLMQQ